MTSRSWDLRAKSGEFVWKNGPKMAKKIASLGFFRATGWSKYPKICFRDIFYEYLDVCQRDFENLDFLRNGGQFSADFG